MIVSLVNQKGGVGKTTMTVNIAGCRHAMGEQVLVVDADPQGSLLQWRSIAGETHFDVQHWPIERLGRKLRPQIRKYDHIMIDSPPGMSAVTRSALSISDMAIIPVGPSPLDIWSSRETIALIAKAARRNRKLSGRMLICRKIVRTRVAREVREALESHGFKVFNAEISQRIAFVESMIAGLTVLQYASRSEAAQEIRNLCQEIFET
jgi:chromosome partitioning protein